jgi:hypothetical protein
MSDKNLTYYRGDSYPQIFTILNAATGAAVDITGYTFKLTVNRDRKPTDASNQLFQIAGIIADAAAGQVSFSFESGHTGINPGQYYYDVQMTTDTGDVRTIVKAVFEVTMDVTK